MLKKLWFKRKRYGWGWTPVTWQGWTVVVAYVIFIIWAVQRFPPEESLATFLIVVIILVASLISITYKTGEKPKWQWGK